MMYNAYEQKGGNHMSQFIEMILSLLIVLFSEWFVQFATHGGRWSK